MSTPPTLLVGYVAPYLFTVDASLPLVKVARDNNPTHFYHATTLQLRAFARHSAS